MNGYAIFSKQQNCRDAIHISGCQELGVLRRDDRMINEEHECDFCNNDKVWQ